MITPYPEHKFNIQQLAENTVTAAQTCVNARPEEVDNCDLVYLLCLAKTLRGEVDILVRELSRERWNNRAASDMHVNVILEELEKPDSNVCVFPNIGRSIGGAI